MYDEPWYWAVQVSLWFIGFRYYIFPKIGAWYRDRQRSLQRDAES